MAEDIFPSNDADFDKFQTQFITAVAANPAKYGLLAADVTALQTTQGAWIVAYPAHVKAQAAARAATQAKEVDRSKLEVALRAAAHKVNGVAGVDNAMRTALGLPPRDGTRSPIGAPTTRPIGRAEPGGPRTLVVHFVDVATPQRLAKPPGVHGCQIWVFVGDTPPVDPSGYTFLALDTRTPYTDEHPGADAGKTAHYLLRWQNAKGEPGPWSDVVTAKIPL